MPSCAQHFKKPPAVAIAVPWPRQPVGAHRLAFLAKGSRPVARVIQRGPELEVGSAMTWGADMVATVEGCSSGVNAMWVFLSNLCSNVHVTMR